MYIKIENNGDFTFPPYRVSLAKGIRQVKDKNVRNTKITFEEVSSNKCNKENTHNSSEIFV